MEPLVLKQRQPVEEEDVENWDDGDFDGLDDIHFRNASTATSVVSTVPPPTRDSASRMSLRSESNQGTDENWDVVVDDQAPIKDALALARSKGIPLPANVPRSALEGGTIRRLNGKAIKKAIADDWSEDLDIPSASEAPLKLAKHDEKDFNESLRQLSAAFRSSPKSPEADLDKTLKSPKSRTTATPISLDTFRDDEEDADFGEVPTIRVAKQRSSGKPTLITPATIPAPNIPESIEEDLELPSNGQLRLSTRKPQPRTPQNGEDFDFEWGEGSLGTRNAGRRPGRSARSSSASALSPSVSSAFTAESEDEGLDGLVLPDGPIAFQKKLEQRQVEQERDAASSPTKERPKSIPQPPADDSFFDDLDLGDGDVFNSTRLKLNKNVKTKNQRPISPSKRTTTTLNFTSGKNQGSSRLPRFSHGSSHERAKSNLEPVSESDGPPTRFQRPNSRLGLHSTQSSVSAIPAPSTPTPSTPSRRAIRAADPRPDVRHDGPTTTSAQLLRAKRSMPVIRGMSSPTKSEKYVRPPSRANAGSRLQIYHERPDSREENKKQPVFLPAGASHGQSQHANLKHVPSKGHIRRADSDGTGDTMSAAQRSLSRIVALGRPETPGRNRVAGMSAAELAAQAKKAVTKPSRRRNYGDGNELDIFDDLPTSASLESKFTKLPVGRGAPRSLRSKFGLGIQSNHSTSTITSLRTTDTPMPQTPLSPPRQDFPTTATSMATANVPRFARDTAASRNAREQRTISTTFQNIHGEPLKPISANFQLSALPHTSLQRPHTSGTGTYGSLRKKKNVQQKPHLIKPLGPDMNREKSEKGMRYNPELYRWEGNENALAPFDIPPPDFHARSGSPIALGTIDKDRKAQGSPVAGGAKANVALISNIGNVAGVQVVGGMVFDPSQMRWLKMKEDTASRNRGDSVGAASVEVEEEEDVFAGLEDLKEEGSEWDLKSQSHRGSAAGMTPQEYGVGMVTAGSKGAPTGLRRKVSNESNSNSDDETGLDGPPVAEEFDVGPEFVKRQRAEEERWRRKVEKWLRTPEDAAREHQDGAWLWDVRSLAA
ncbi:uncharacterized protein AB675_10271 [Cyphellophora attinorum]|uniref:Protein byr4 n=1 Tax=Cyphellophora attinorum TaxID=1664694 RepID=A0A0N1HKW6_9EURO|nr:uncharacterized protein AB675_10271 [Phialophora attinorum]KPI37485.1 hypothetical protein AB675_10271 [Phialophora attinorum]